MPPVTSESVDWEMLDGDPKECANESNHSDSADEHSEKQNETDDSLDIDFVPPISSTSPPPSPYSQSPSSPVGALKPSLLVPPIHSPSPKQVTDAPQTKTFKEKATSAIRTAVETAGEGGKPRLLDFFKIATKEEYAAHVASEREDFLNRREDVLHDEALANLQRATRERERQRLKKQRQRSAKKNVEIQRGERSPGGTKRKVCDHLY